MLASTPEGSAARLFGDHLTSLSIDNTVEQGESVFSVWVHDDDRLDAARREWEQFIANPTDPRYAAAGEAARRKLQQDQSRDEARRQNFVDVRTQWSTLSSRPMPLTMLLLAASVVVTFLTKFGEDLEPVANKLLIASVELTESEVRWNGLREILHGQVWRLITPIFLHMSIMHILFNMWWLIDLGSAIERRKGTWWMAYVVVTAAVTSNLAQYWWSGPLFGGMSGVGYALFGYAWMKGKFEPQDGIAVSPQTTVFMIGWLLLCMTGWLGPIANAAHVVGLLAGMAAGHAPYSWRKFQRARRFKS
jgi:GlpG protein